MRKDAESYSLDLILLEYHRQENALKYPGDSFQELKNNRGSDLFVAIQHANPSPGSRYVVPRYLNKYWLKSLWKISSCF
jgi:hypothetical protein